MINALWMALLFLFLGADLLAIGIFEKYAVDIGACIVCYVVGTATLFCHIVARKREERRGRTKQ
jgi:hypothetical protein